MRNLAYENEFDLHGNEDADGTHFHMIMNGFTRKLVLTQAKGNSAMGYSFDTQVTIGSRVEIVPFTNWRVCSPKDM